MPLSHRNAGLRPAWRGIAIAMFLAVGSTSAASIPRQISTSQLLSSYDYVIVGGGTAGLTVADRLTEDADTTVLVLEAGGLGDLDETALVSTSLRDTIGEQSMMWGGITSVPQVNLGNATTSVDIGKVVGGGSAVNAMYNMRGSAEDYDRWDQLFDGSNSSVSWSWEGMLPYFKKGLHFIAPPADLTEKFDIKYDASNWGNSSEIYAGWPTFYWPGVIPLLDAFKEIDGVEFPSDSGAGTPGVYWFPSLVDPSDHTRSYARTGHYSNVNATRSNYHLLTNTQARRILLDADLAATGVEFPLDDSSYVNITADKEVIMSAGAIHTPQLLQLSGIGPKSLLEAGGIEVLVDLPGVGQNFQDHSSLSIAVNITLTNITSIHPNPNDLVEGSAFQNWTEEVWAANRSGPYSIASSGNVCAWLPLTAVSDNADALATKLEEQDFGSLLPDGTDSTVVKGYETQMKALAAQMRSSSTTWTRLQLAADSGLNGPVLMQSFSRGSVNINTTDPWATEPAVDYRALSNPVESDVFVELIRFSRRYNFNTSLAETYAPREYSPGANVTSDADLKAYVAANLSPTDWHPVGTCAMMPKDLGGVVDQTLRVHGVKNLRVVDGSVIPMLPSANTCQPIYAIAEKAAEIIKSGVTA